MPRLSLPATSATLVQRLIHLAARFTRPMTLGVRAILLDEDGQVFLVRHSYVPGWHCPGGAVEVGGEPDLHGVFLNRSVSRRDHVAVYVVRAFRRIGPRPADWEIIETGFFPAGALPEGTTRATRARLDEVLNGAAKSPLW